MLKMTGGTHPYPWPVFLSGEGISFCLAFAEVPANGSSGREQNRVPEDRTIVDGLYAFTSRGTSATNNVGGYENQQIALGVTLCIGSEEVPYKRNVPKHGNLIVHGFDFLAGKSTNDNCGPIKDCD